MAKNNNSTPRSERPGDVECSDADDDEFTNPFDIIDRLKGEIKDLKPLESTLKLRTRELARARELFTKSEKRVLDYLKQVKTLGNKLTERNEEVERLKKEAKKLKDKLEFEIKYRVGLHRNKMKVERDYDHLEHSMKLKEIQYQALKKDHFVEKRNGERERGQRLIDMHKREVAEDAHREMAGQLNDMKLLASDAVKSEQRTATRVEPLRVALKSAEHLAEYYEEQDIAHTADVIRAERHVMDADARCEAMAEELEMAKQKTKYLMDTLGAMQKQYAKHAVTNTDKAKLVTIVGPSTTQKIKFQKKSQNQNQNSPKSDQEAGYIPDNPQTENKHDWERNLHSSQVLQALGLYNVSCFEANPLVPHNAVNRRYQSNTFGSLMHSNGVQLNVPNTYSQEATITPAPTTHNERSTSNEGNLPPLTNVALEREGSSNTIGTSVTADRVVKIKSRRAEFEAQEKKLLALVSGGSGFVGRGLGLRKVRVGGLNRGSARQVIAAIREKVNGAKDVLRPNGQEIKNSERGNVARVLIEEEGEDDEVEEDDDEEEEEEEEEEEDRDGFGFSSDDDSDDSSDSIQSESEDRA